jgi:ubiquitin carboxyl-terminal hydrolase 34
MDVKTLASQTHKNNDDREPDLASYRYLSAYGYLLRKDEGSHIGRNLETHYSWNWDDDIQTLSDSFQTEGGSITALTKLVHGQLKLMPRNPKIVDHFTEPCRIAAKIVVDASSVADERNIHQQSVEAAHQKLLQGYEFFKVMTTGLESVIEKHVTHLSPDAAMAHLTGLSLILQSSLRIGNPLTRELVEKQHLKNSAIPQSKWPRVISLEWKFNILKKLITSAQMQLRVVGVTTMCNDLLAIYASCKGNDPTTSPVLLYFADFILQNQLVDYIVGIGSHPEIINESSNIVGFLIVTKTYKTQQTDRIWQTVMSSQDPRVVDAILKMMIKCLNLFDYQTLLCLCNKVSEVPIEAFTMGMRDFCQSLFKDLVQKYGQEGVPYLNAPPYDLCVRLIRESSIVTNEAPAGYPDVQNFAANRFRELLQFGPGTETRNSIYASCIEDISSKTATAPGSICVISTLIRQNSAKDLRVLTTEHGLTKLLVEELESAIVGDRQSSNMPIRNSPASQARRELLHTIITTEPGTISQDLGKRLWHVLVGSEFLTIADRTTSWQILNTAVKKTSVNNVFLASCYKDHLPRLRPECFTNGALEFVREALIAWLDEVRRDFVEEDRRFESHALDQLWRMILTAPPNTIDAAAITILVEVYVESALILSLPRAKSRTIHLALVDRCLKQLKAAATQLKDFSDGASSGPEEGMVIVASEDQFQEQEKIFARSLAVLREFLKSYQSKPQFATPKLRSPIVTTSNTVEGEPLTVKYQSFDGDKHTDVKSLTLGKLNPPATLFASLQKATGFKNYKVYCGGKVIDPDEVEVCKSLEDLNLNGLVLVQRRDDTDSSSGHSNSNKTTLELEITKHFDDLWSYLSMHEKVAQEVSTSSLDCLHNLTWTADLLLLNQVSRLRSSARGF